MKTGMLLGMLAVMFWAMAALGEGYSIQPDDALIFPLGEEGTPYADLEPGVRGGSLHFAVNEDPKSWNHHTAHETNTSLFTWKMHQGLLALNPLTGAIVVNFAKSYEVSEDNRVLTFRLRKGIRWSDGTPITADDVLFTYNDLILNEDVDCNARDSQLLPDGTFPVLEKMDDHTVRFTLSTPYRPILTALMFGLMPEHKLAPFVHKCNPDVPAGTFNETWTLDTPVTDLVGNGPYIVSDYQANTSVTMVRNPFFYGYDSAGTQLPYYDRIVATIVSNRDVSMLKFRNGDTDIYGLRPEDVPVLLAHSGDSAHTVMVTDRAAYGTSWIVINQDIGLANDTDAEKRALYRNVEFREALAHLLDKEALIQNTLNGMGIPQWSPVSIPSPFYAGRTSYGGPITEANAICFEYNPSLAADKLDALGVVDRDGDGWRDLPSGAPFSIEINTSDNTIGVETCLIFQDDLRAVGLNAIFQILGFNTLVDRLMTATSDLVALGLSGGDEPNDGKNVYASCGALHLFRYSACDEPTEVDKRIDELLDLAASTFNLDEAFEYYKEFQILVARQLGLLYRVMWTFNYAYYNHVGNASAASPIATPTAGLTVFCFDRRLL